MLETCASAEALTHVRRLLLLGCLVVGPLVAVATDLGLGRVLLLMLVAAWMVCYVDRLFAFRRIRGMAWRRTSGRMWWVVPWRRRSLARDRAKRKGLIVPYTPQVGRGTVVGYHFIGAGAAWSEQPIEIDVAPPLATESEGEDGQSNDERQMREVFRSVEELIGAAHGKNGVTPFTPDDLHEYVAGELRRPFDPKPQFNPDNRLDVFDVAATSGERWKDITKDRWHALMILARKGVEGSGASAETKEARRFLCTRIVSWDGELVASVYVSFAYEHHYLRVVARPHVIHPVHMTLRTAVRRAVEAGFSWHVRELANAFLDLPSLVNSLRKPFSSRRPDADPGKGPVSLREIYSSPYMDDMLQYDDARRYVGWMERRIFGAVAEFLVDHNVEIQGYMKQATVILQNSGVIAGSIGGDVQNQPGSTGSTIHKTQVPSAEGQK
ncbi:hypothetical protein [Streptomyces endophyticus]|uniref:Uncharacterized protein n=1 Tax=Streptomyces endophyticus TaxID=714166 RepID=A0ABU6F7U9_9ACTN|nr:hypothetical protein [Streptomyces endophyticus]MEB8339435.1 hypothetical protein [Streptomyces endophyticus]